MFKVFFGIPAGVYQSVLDAARKTWQKPRVGLVAKLVRSMLRPQQKRACTFRKNGF
jgi:hypothetical protein